jgi:glycosyltransferase involved in cell wall biosynthesis
LTANVGPGHARQVGIEHAHGKYIALLDSDDIWLPGKLETQLSVLERHPEIDLMFTDYLNIDHRASREYSAFSRVRASLSKLTLRRAQGHPEHGRGVTVRDRCDGACVIEDGLAEAIMAENFILPSTVVARRTTVNGVGGSDARLRTGEDLELWWRLLLAGATFAYIDRILVHRHRHDASQTAGADFAPDCSRAVAMCHAAAIRAGRNDLARHVRERQYRMWHAFMHARLAEGRRLSALLAFVRNLRYAATVRTCLVAVAALLGPTAIRRLPRPT